MPQCLACITLLVRDYDEAITWYTKILGFALVEDTILSPDKRWVLIAPRGTMTPRLLLAKAATPEQQAHIGNQAGGRVLFFLHTDDFQRDYHNLKANGVEFQEEPRHETYGTVAVFEDLYGNKWDLLQPKAR